MATIENIADDHDMYVSDYYSHIYNIYLEWNYTRSTDKILEIESVWRLEEFVDHIECSLYDASHDWDIEQYKKYINFLKFILKTI